MRSWLCPTPAAARFAALIKSDARYFKQLLVIPDLAGLSSMWVGTRDLGGTLGLHISQTLLHRGPQLFKRVFDLLLACAACLLLLPVIVLIILAIRLDIAGAHRLRAGARRPQQQQVQGMEISFDVRECR